MAIKKKQPLLTCSYCSQSSNYFGGRFLVRFFMLQGRRAKRQFGISQEKKDPQIAKTNPFKSSDLVDGWRSLSLFVFCLFVVNIKLSMRLKTLMV